MLHAAAVAGTLPAPSTHIPPLSSGGIAVFRASAVGPAVIGAGGQGRSCPWGRERAGKGLGRGWAGAGQGRAARLAVRGETEAGGHEGDHGEQRVRDPLDAHRERKEQHLPPEVARHAKSSRGPIAGIKRQAGAGIELQAAAVAAALTQTGELDLTISMKETVT